MIGGSGEKVTLRIVAQYADIWNGFGNPEEAGRRNRILDDWCARVGRDPAAIERSVLRGEPISDDRADDYVANDMTFIITAIDQPGADLSTLERLVAWRDRRNQPRA